jgi:UPF0271 protein
MLPAHFGQGIEAHAGPRGFPGDCIMARHPAIDLNADLGEGFGPYRIGDDAAMLGVVTSANIACGFHAGDPEVLYATLQAARGQGVTAGAHPGFADRAHFGRRLLPTTEAEVERMVAYQVGAAMAVGALAGHPIAYVKAHGALYNLAAVDDGIARALARAIRAVDPSLWCLMLAGSRAARLAEAEGLAVAHEAFADRAYLPDGTLMPRDRPGAVLHDAQAIAARCVAMLRHGALTAIDGSRITAPVHSICVHGDTPGAVAIAQGLRAALLADGVTLAPFAHP